MIGCEVMKKRKMLTVDWVFLIGIILIAIIGGIIEGVYWHITDIEPLPKYTLRSGVVSYIYWIILWLFSNKCCNVSVTLIPGIISSIRIKSYVFVLTFSKHSIPSFASATT